jgi:hypothetical protein
VGRTLSVQEHREVLDWGEHFSSIADFPVTRPPGRALRVGAARDLKLYWNLAALSRAGERRKELSSRAHQIVFRVRTRLEKLLTQRVDHVLRRGDIGLPDLFEGGFFGCSIKQGVSLRLPLTSCNPTAECGSGCYAHDGMDAGQNPVVKGVLDGLVASSFQHGGDRVRAELSEILRLHARRAVAAARREAAAAGFSRQPRIRFSHVGEITAYPQFANVLAQLVWDESKGEVACVVYTRHPQARLLDPGLFVVNFTIDRSSWDRIAWAPVGARITYSAWSGETSAKVDVNFVEHHRFGHFAPSGGGKVCPATAPLTQVRTCDAVKCDFCFNKPNLILPTAARLPRKKGGWR